jgi:hypothetical protein
MHEVLGFIPSVKKGKEIIIIPIEICN